MKRFAVSCLVLLLAVAVALPMLAQEEKKAKNKGKGRKTSAIAGLKKQLEELDLTAEQEEKIDQLLEEAEPKLTAAQEKIAAVLPREQRRARAEAMKKAREEGKKGREAREAADASLQLTAEQKAQLEAAEQEARRTQMDLRRAVAALLTPEQRAKIDLQLEKSGKKGKKKRNQAGSQQ